MSYSSYRSYGTNVRRKPRYGYSKPKGRAFAKSYIDPSRFVKAASPREQETHVAAHHFKDFKFEALLHANLAKKGYLIPSPIQDEAIPAGLAQKNVIGIASTGTGKTAAFALPVLHRLLTEPGSAALIVAPTRELAQQIETECRQLAKGSGLFGTLLIGGAGMGGQLRDLRMNPRIIIGTPGRIKDHLKRGTLKLDKFNMVVLDEVDRMLDMGFVHDVTEILTHLSAERQSFFFSATIDNRVRTLIDKFASDPVTIKLGASSASENVHQDVVRYQSSSEKLDKLHNLLVHDTVEKVIIFEETQRSVERLNNELVVRGFLTDALHGGKTQGQRQRALAKFKNNQVNILVATDVAARGIDIVDITHVVNYSTPKDYDDYIHRIGRAGRAGNVGHALTFVSSN